MAKNIVTLNLDNTDYSLRPYGTCSTAAATAAKTVSITGFTLCSGATILVKFSNSNTIVNPTLNVNGTGDKPIIHRGHRFDPSIYYEFIYDGSSWTQIGEEKHRCSVASGNKNNYPWHRIAYTDVLTTQYIRRTISLILNQATFGGKYGELVIKVATNATNNASSYEAYWVVNKGFGADDIKIGVNNTFGNTYFDVFYKCPGAWYDLLIEQKTGGYDSNFTKSFTLCSSQEVSDTTATDRLTSIECYSTIEAAATELHNTAYTTIISPNTSSGTLGKISFNGDLTGNAATATNADTLDGHDSTYFATAADYVKKSGDTMTGDLTLKTSTSGTPSIIFQRGETNDTFEDWKLTDVAGCFKFQNRNSTGSWVDVLSLSSMSEKQISSIYSLLPSSTNTLDLGSSSLKWKNVFATTFTGSLSGNATSATTATTATSATQVTSVSSDDVNSCNGNKLLKYYILAGNTADSEGKRFAGTANNYGFPVTSNANGLLWLGNHSTNFGHQLGFSSNGKIYHRKIDNGVFPTTEKGGSWKQLAFTSDIPAAYSHPTNGANTSVGPSANASPSHGGTFTVPYITVNDLGHVTAASNKTITLPAAYSHPTGGANTSVGPSANASPSHGGTFTVPYITVNNLGHVTAASNKTITLPNTTQEAYLSWGGRSLAASLSPVDVATDGQWSTNRLSFMPATGIQVEYSTNGGTSWVDYGLTDEQKQSLVTTGLSQTLYMGNNSTSQSVNDMLRVTITAESEKTYFSLKKIYAYLSTNGANSTKVKIEKAMNGSDTTFVEVGEYPVSGWSGWNSIPLIALFGGGDNQTGNIRRIRMTFYFTAYGTNYGPDATNKVKFYITNIQMMGETSWSNSGGNLSKTGHMYYWDISKNVTFPAGLKATTIYENGTALSSKYYHSNSTASANMVLAAPASDNGKVSFRKLVVADMPNGLKANTDNRSINQTPTDYNGVFQISGLKNNSAIGLDATTYGTYSHVWGMKCWSGATGGQAHEFANTQSGILMHRYGKSESEWNAWTQIIEGETASTTDIQDLFK